MSKTGTANLPLHGGKAPRWLFSRMEKMAGEISRLLVRDYGREELLKRLSDPYWFQGFGCVLGFDWHSSGLTTTVMGALKEALQDKELGVKVVGGKGKNSRKAPEEVESAEYNLSTSDLEALKKTSKMSAKVDNNCVQDSYSLYHHTLVFTEGGDWCVVQQGMNDSYARRYHWLGESIEIFVEEPQNAICSQEKKENALNLTSNSSEETREISVDLVNDNPEHLKRFVKDRSQTSLRRWSEEEETRVAHLDMPKHHAVSLSDLSERSIDQLRRAYEIQPENFEELAAVEGVGRKSLRSLALISELVYGSENSWKDPAKYSYSVGGKDGTPYEIDRDHYDSVVDHLKGAVEQAEVGRNEKSKALKRLKDYIN